MIRIGIIIPCFNELATATFAIAPWIGKADEIIVLDSGSTDGTDLLVQDIFSKAIQTKQITFIQLGNVNFNMGYIRNYALDILRRKKCDWFFKIDADDIFYTNGVDSLINAVQNAETNCTRISISNYELYQWQASDTLSWLNAILDENPLFYEMSIRPNHTRAIKDVPGLYASGYYYDEARGLKPEGFAYDKKIPGHDVSFNDLAAAHYGWARPLNKKKEKIKIWNGSPDSDPRVNTLHLIDDYRWPKPSILFNNHPEVFHKMGYQVHSWLVSNGYS